MLAHLFDEPLGEEASKIGAKVPRVQDQLLLQFALRKAPQCTLATARTNAHETLARAKQGC